MFKENRFIFQEKPSGNFSKSLGDAGEVIGKTFEGVGKQVKEKLSKDVIHELGEAGKEIGEDASKLPGQGIGSGFEALGKAGKEIGEKINKLDDQDGIGGLFEDIGREFEILAEALKAIEVKKGKFSIGDAGRDLGQSFQELGEQVANLDKKDEKSKLSFADLGRKFEDLGKIISKIIGPEVK